MWLTRRDGADLGPDGQEVSGNGGRREGKVGGEGWGYR